jgi:integrase
LQAVTGRKPCGPDLAGYLAALSHALSFAVKERRLMERNPVGDIRRKSERRGRTRFLSDDDHDALLKACEKSAWPALRSLVLLAIATGARKGELTGLKWADVDLTKGRARVRETKNDESRTVPPAGQTPQALWDLKLVKRYSHLVVDHKAKVIEKMIAARGSDGDLTQGSADTQQTQDNGRCRPKPGVHWIGMPTR